MIKLLDTGHLIAPLPTSHTTAQHHRACLIRDEYANRVHVHIKAFPADSKGLANEIAGHLLHQAAGINTARRAWLIVLNRHELTTLFPTVDIGSDEEWLCWATEHIDGMPINALDAWTWGDELAAWPDTATCIALHEWLWAIDGNAGNLISTGHGDFAAIDHADILGGQHWTAKMLRHNLQRRFYNKALHIAWGGTPTPQQRQAAREKARRHGQILQAAWPHIHQWWQSMLKQKDIDAAYAFLTDRAAPGWIDNRL